MLRGIEWAAGLFEGERNGRGPAHKRKDNRL